MLECKFMSLRLHRNSLVAVICLSLAVLGTALGFAYSTSLGGGSCTAGEAEQNGERMGVEYGELDEVARVIHRNSKRVALVDAYGLARLILDESSNSGLDPMLVLAVIKAESGFSANAVSGKGAVGLMQLMPSTARFVAESVGIDYQGRHSLHDPLVNVKFGIRYLGMLNERYGSVERALVAYNFGPNRAIVRRVDIKRPPSYVRRVLRYKTELTSEGSQI